MKLNRIGTTAAVAVMASLALAACGDDNPTGTDTSAAGDSGTSLSGTLKGSGASSQESAMTAWIAGYQGVQPDVTVQYDSVGSGAASIVVQGGLRQTSRPSWSGEVSSRLQEAWPMPGR